MANLPNETITTVLNLERRLLQLINEATAAGFIILEQFGETEETIPELDELQNVRERATSYYIRLYRLLLQISESQQARLFCLEKFAVSGGDPRCKNTATFRCYAKFTGFCQLKKRRL